MNPWPKRYWLAILFSNAMFIACQFVPAKSNHWPMVFGLGMFGFGFAIAAMTRK